MRGWLKVLIVVGVIALVGIIIFFNTPAGKRAWNGHQYGITKADDETSYEKKKLVEDTCRAMVTTYESDKITYESYKDSDDEDMQDVAVQAKIRANSTATKYNEYMLKNSNVWKDNIPEDLKEELPLIE